MSKKPTKSKATKPKSKTVIMFGLDKDRKPHGARFTGESDAALARTAALMGLRLAVPGTQKHFELVNKLPISRIPTTGNTAVPIIDPQLYAQINSVVGGEPGAISASLPKASAQLAPGHLVVAQYTIEEGWWPAIIIKRSGDTVTLKWRDDPGEAEVVRPISSLALLSAD